MKVRLLSPTQTRLQAVLLTMTNKGQTHHKAFDPTELLSSPKHRSMDQSMECNDHVEKRKDSAGGQGDEVLQEQHYDSEKSKLAS